jgi:DNA-binding transcriptional ArsR family regulator
MPCVMPPDQLSDALLARIAPLLKVCGHPLRLRILCAIESRSEPCVSELWTCLDQSQPVVSQHLAVLKRYGIVSSRVLGNRRVYTIAEPFVRSLVRGLLSGDARAGRAERAGRG